jgi:hypothetical protein
MTIVNDNSSVINKPGASLTDEARVVIYDRHMFIVRPQSKPYWSNLQCPPLKLSSWTYWQTLVETIYKHSGLFCCRVSGRRKKSFIALAPGNPAVNFINILHE